MVAEAVMRTRGRAAVAIVRTASPRSPERSLLVPERRLRRPPTTRQPQTANPSKSIPTHGPAEIQARAAALVGGPARPSARPSASMQFMVSTVELTEEELVRKRPTYAGGFVGGTTSIPSLCGAGQRSLIGRVLHDRRPCRDLDRVPAVRLIRSERAARPARVAPPVSREGAHPTCRQSRRCWPGEGIVRPARFARWRTGRWGTGWATSAPGRGRPSAGAKPAIRGPEN